MQASQRSWQRLVKLNDAQISAKCVEVSKCLVDAGTGMVDFDLNATRKVGDAARLAVAIRRHPTPIDRETLAGVSSALKINFRIVESDLVPMFEELGWAIVKREGDKVSSIIDSVPPAADVLSTLGKTWREKQPTSIDEATINSLAELSRRPYGKSALLSELGIEEGAFESMLDYGEGAGYLGRFKSEEQGVEAIWTPLYWQANAESVIKFIQKQNEERLQTIGSLTDRFRNYPGLPTEKVANSSVVLTTAGIQQGFFPSVAITDRRKTSHTYIFPPSPQFNADASKDVYEKARLIVACIRHGQHHAEVTRILYPRSILRSMRNNLLGPHSYANVQYYVLVLHGIVTLEPVEKSYGKAYKVVWLDTPENNLAADIADSLLQGKEPIATSGEELEARKILLEGAFSYSSELRKLKTTKEVKAKKEYDRLLELATGVKL
jgi:hypothetical protein